MSGLTGLWAPGFENFQEIRILLTGARELIKILSCMEPLPEQASTGSVAWLQPERLLKQTILHISPTDLGFVMVLSSFSRYLHASCALEIPFPMPLLPGSSPTRKGTSRRRPWERGCPFPSSQFDAGSQLVSSWSLRQMVSWNSQSTYEKRGEGGNTQITVKAL